MGAVSNRAIDSLHRLDRRIIALLWVAVLAVGITAYVFRDRGGLASLTRILREANPWWLFGALTTHLLILGFVVATYRIVLRRLGHRIGWWALMRLQLQREVVGTLAPLGGPASLYVYLRGLKRRAVAADDALLAAGMRGATDSAAFLVLLALVLAIHPPPLSVLFGLALTVAALGIVIALAVRWKGMRRWCGLHLPDRVHQFLAQSRTHAIGPADLLCPFGLAVLARIASVAMLYAALRALGEDPSLLLPLVATVIGNLSRKLAPVFQGLGVVEASVAAALERQGISDAAAIGAALLCRLGNLWLPLSLALLAQSADWLRNVRRPPALWRWLSLLGRPRARDGLSA